MEGVSARTKNIVYAIICMDQRLLTAKRNSGVRKNIWEFPGGRVESGETQGQAVARKIREELGLYVNIDRHLTTIRDNREDYALFVHVYPYRYVRGEIHPYTHYEYALVTPHKLYGYQFEAADQPILDILRENVL